MACAEQVARLLDASAAEVKRLEGLLAEAVSARSSPRPRRAHATETTGRLAAAVRTRRSAGGEASSRRPSMRRRPRARRPARARRAGRAPRTTSPPPRRRRPPRRRTTARRAAEACSPLRSRRAPEPVRFERAERRAGRARCGPLARAAAAEASNRRRRRRRGTQKLARRQTQPGLDGPKFSRRPRRCSAARRHRQEAAAEQEAALAALRGEEAKAAAAAAEGGGGGGGESPIPRSDLRERAQKARARCRARCAAKLEETPQGGGGIQHRRARGAAQGRLPRSSAPRARPNAARARRRFLEAELKVAAMRASAAGGGDGAPDGRAGGGGDGDARDEGASRSRARPARLIAERRSKRQSGEQRGGGEASRRRRILDGHIAFR